MFYGEWLNNDMHGHGFYFYKDGIRYDGCFEHDKKGGYGTYMWTDGRIYSGWWHAGKQHGLGTYYDPVKQVKKFGMWEHGKRVKWFDEVQQEEIRQRKYDISTHFNDKVASFSVLREQYSFEKPSGLDAKLAEIQRNLKLELK